MAISLIRELGPVLSALMVTGRAGSALTAEIGIMRITEQIDALTVMALNPFRYLVAPSVLAGVVTFPLMTALFDAVGIFGGYLVGVQLLGLSEGTYFGEMQTFVDLETSCSGSGSRSRSASWSRGSHVQGLPRGPRGRGRGARHHPGRRPLLRPDPRLGLLPGLGAPVSPAPPMIKVEGLDQVVPAQRVLRGIDLEVPDGSITVIIGRSGGGKSVFLRHLLGLVRPDAGRVIYRRRRRDGAARP